MTNPDPIVTLQQINKIARECLREFLSRKHTLPPRDITERLWAENERYRAALEFIYSRAAYIPADIAEAAETALNL